MKQLMAAMVMVLANLCGFAAHGAQSATQPAAPAPGAATAAAPEPAPALVDPAIIDAALKQLVDSQQIIGVSALVYERGNEAYFGAFGLADRENNKPMTRDRSRIGCGRPRSMSTLARRICSAPANRCDACSKAVTCIR